MVNLLQMNVAPCLLDVSSGNSLLLGGSGYTRLIVLLHLFYAYAVYVSVFLVNSVV